jgi:hypothetical protein
MKLRNCVFSGNVLGEGAVLIGAKTSPFDVDYCYFSDSGPTSSQANVGLNCLTNYTTAPYPVFAINTAYCPAVRAATATATATPSASKSALFALSLPFFASE